ncbi:cyclin-domain-containing protein [Podospora fimiseda]|uniref:Cyclin-domain-containing protein n=1 Tax=Podospora fimiseda TaxID=252190 RepID=A0AAN7BNA0_9PEZI|nr:cyclin-domain-containing protein [Podospora fimiseda]
MMLTHSPVVATSTNAPSPRGSFHNFGAHYASTSRQQLPSSSPRVQVPAIAKSLRQSPSSTAVIAPITPKPPPSPPPPQQQQQSLQQQRYVGVDAATQYSPMEPMDYVTGAIVPRDQPAETAKPAALPPPPPPPSSSEQNNNNKPMAMSTDVAAKAAPGPSKQQAVVPASPSKRRNSDADRSEAAPGDAGQNTSVAKKRAKPEEAPPKVLPEKYELCQAEDMVVLIAHMLGELIETNDALALKSGHLTRFHSRTAPGISVLDYLHRLAKHATLTPPLLLSMVYYIDRLCAMYPEFTINTLTVHRFLITAGTVASKGLSDSFWNNSTYARVGGVRLAELKLLELEFLYRVDWRIIPNPDVLVAYYRGLVERCPGYTFEQQEEESDNDNSDVFDSEDEGLDEEETEN